MQVSQTYPSHDTEHIPYHVAIIMDGNGRWANSRSLKRTEGHQEGAKVIPNIVKAFGQNGVKMLTLSTKPKIDRNNLFLINTNLLILYKTINQNHHF